MYMTACVCVADDGGGLSFKHVPDSMLTAVAPALRSMLLSVSPESLACSLSACFAGGNLPTGAFIDTFKDVLGLTPAPPEAMEVPIGCAPDPSNPWGCFSADPSAWRTTYAPLRVPKAGRELVYSVQVRVWVCGPHARPILFRSSSLPFLQSAPG
jgi:hypothetical protein